MRQIIRAWLAAIVCLGAFSASIPAGAAEKPISFGLQFDEPQDRPAERIRWPVTVGVPFAEAAINDDTRVRVVDRTGKPLALQTKITGYWQRKEKSPKWVLLDFQEEFGKEGKLREPILSVRTGTSPAGDTKPGAKVSITQTPARISIDTGAISFQVSKQNFALVENLKLAGGTEVMKSSAAYWLDADGQRYETEHAPADLVVVENEGPQRVVIRAEGWYAPLAASDAAGTKKMRYQIRITAFAGLPYIRIYHTLIWTEDDQVVMPDFGLDFSVAEPATRGRLGQTFGNTIGTELGPVEAVQDTFEQGRLRKGTKRAAVRQLSGWAQVRGERFGVAVAVRDLAMQLPKAFTLRSNKLNVQLWAPQNRPMSMKEKDQLAPGFPPEFYKFPREWENYNKTINPQGAAKTHEIWLWPTDGDNAASGVSCETVNDYVQRPIVAMANPDYQCGTDAITGIRPRGKLPESHAYMEDVLEAMFLQVISPDEKEGDFDMWNFGDVRLMRSGFWRKWENGGNNWPAVPWQLYYRSGQRQFLVAGQRNARHVMDADLCHHGALTGPAYTKVLGYTYVYSSMHWSWGPLWSTFWTHPEYLLHCYHLTGYERAADVLQLMAGMERRRGVMPSAKNVDPATVSREAYGPIKPLMVYYEFTGEPYFLRAAQGWSEVALAARDARKQFVNNTFGGFFFRGLEMVAENEPTETAIAGCLVELVSEFAKPTTLPCDAPNWYRDNLLPFAAAYRRTKDIHYLSYPLRHIDLQMREIGISLGKTVSKGLGLGSDGVARHPMNIDATLRILGAWHDAGYARVPAWPGNYPFFGSATAENKTGSTLTLFLQKNAAKPGRVKLHFVRSNLSTWENLDGKKMTATLLRPDGQRREIPLTLAPAQIVLEADEPAGTYRLEIVGEQAVFYVSPQTDLPGLVVAQATAGLRLRNDIEPAQAYFRLKPGSVSLRVKQLTAGYEMAMIMGKNNQPLGLFNIDDQRSYVDVAIPTSQQTELLSIAKGYWPVTVRSPNLPSISLEGADPYFAVQPQQWFLPEGK